MRRRGSALFHGTDFAVPYVPLRPSVMTVHDLSPWRTGGSARIRQRTPFLIRAGVATMILTPSEAVRQEVIETFRVSPARVAAVPLAAPKWMQPVDAPTVSNPYLLCVATIEERKNIPMIIDAWRGLRREHGVDLVLAGRVAEGQSPPPVEPGLRFLGSVNDRELPALYSRAIACLYPSLYEGFGLPVLEAMQCGAMVITSRDAAVLETGGGAAVAIDAHDGRAWSEAMRAAITNREFVADRRRASLARASQFTWTRTAEGTYAVYLAARRRFRGS
jgi:glycosyltransferase involved in cell wall biosynthesis